MIPRRPLAALAAASLLALAGCSDGPFAPMGPLAGQRYLLSHVDGRPLPAVLWEEPTGARLEIVGESLEFRPFSRVARERMLRHTSADGVVETRTLRRDTYYRVVQASEVGAPGLVLDVGEFFDCSSSPTALSVACDPDEQAVVSDGELTMTSVVYGAMSATTMTRRFLRTDMLDHVEAQRGRP